MRMRKDMRGRRPKSLALIGVGVSLAIALIAGGVVVLPRLTSHAAVANPNCSLFVPNNPLSARGLATPYQLAATDAAGGPCNEANAGQSAFVQATILDPATGALSAYEPLVIDQGTKPAVQPTAPKLPANAVVGLWFGFNGTILHLRGDVKGGVCNNGTPNSNFGQFAACNAPAFFKAANQAITAGKLKIPALGMANDGTPCPSVRDFRIVDMDQSDNVQTQYLVTTNGQVAQFSAANQAKLAGAKPMGNPSDNALVSKILDPVLGCTPFTVPDLANPGTNTPTLAGDELEAAADQQAPIALVPAGDEMVLVNGNTNLNKVNAYRTSVDQAPAATLNDASTTTYCTNMLNLQLPSMIKDQALFQKQPSPDGGATANSLFTFLANRLNASLGNGGLNCTGLLKIQNPVTLTTDANGVVTAATIAPKAVPVGGGQGNGGQGNGGNGNGGQGNGGAKTPLTLTATYKVNSQWAGGFNVTMVVNNTSQAPTRNWQVQFTFPGDQVIPQNGGWGGVFTQSGNQVTITNDDDNAHIDAGESVTLGFNGTWAKNNTSPTIFTATATAANTVTTVTGSNGMLSATYHLNSQWNTGLNVTMTIANNGKTAINGWKVQFAFGGDQMIPQNGGWGGVFTQAGQQVTITNEADNGMIDPGETVTFGFNATWAKDDTSPATLMVSGTPAQ